MKAIDPQEFRTLYLAWLAVVREVYPGLLDDVAGTDYERLTDVLRDAAYLVLSYAEQYR